MRGVHLIDGAGHWVEQEQPDQVSRLLVQFLKSTAKNFRPRWDRFVAPTTQVFPLRGRAPRGSAYPPGSNRNASD
jgi:hypothetical protein